VEQTMVATAKGEMRTVTLPDGSTAILNGGSTLTFANEWEEDRELSMEGQVFYQVKKGSAFTVHTDNGDVQVLGTSFDVASRNKYFRVKCETGKVKVTITGDEEIITPGEEVVAINNHLEKKSFDVSAKAWRAGELQFNEENLNDVWTAIENQFGVKIIAPKSDTRHFNGTVSTTSLSDALQTVCLAMNLRFEMKNDYEVLITQK
jgi:ferric-dicitrate binding protein FerR (iron transport regulator)